VLPKSHHQDREDRGEKVLSEGEDFLDYNKKNPKKKIM